MTKKPVKLCSLKIMLSIQMATLLHFSWRGGKIRILNIGGRGGCSFVQKVRQMEDIGAAVAIIIDNTGEDVDHILMSDDGTGNGIRIPSMLISKADGLKLIDFINTASEEERSQTALAAAFVMEHPDNRVEYDIWFSSSNDRALDFIHEFESVD